jgi:CBS domain-containing protein
VDHKQATVKAYSTLLAKDVSGVAVVDDSGSLVGCLSASDLRGSTPGRLFQEFHLPVRKFLENSQMARFGKTTSELDCCRVGDTLGSVLERLVDVHIHRVFVVDADQKPIGVISLSEFIRQLRSSLSAE